MSTAKRMRDRKASLHITLTIPAVGHMPFDHRPLSEIGNHAVMAKHIHAKFMRAKRLTRREKTAMEYGFEPDSLLAEFLR